MAFPAKKPKPDFLDDVVKEMGPSPSGKNDGDNYGATMAEGGDDGDGADDESDPEEASQDRVMAAKTILNAMKAGDAAKLADALKAFVSSCSSTDGGGDMGSVDVGSGGDMA